MDFRGWLVGLGPSSRGFPFRHHWGRTDLGRIVGLNRGPFFSVLAGVIVGAVLMTTLPAAADDGHHLVLGETNTATTPTKVWTRRGVLFRASKMDPPAATFVVRSGPPIAVDSSDKVETLNADLLDGHEATDFLRGVQVVYETRDTEIPIGMTLVVNAFCPIDHVVTGGGVRSVRPAIIDGSYPSRTTGDAWIGEFANPTGSAISGIFTSYAICAPIGWKS
jgi:hypothetical protein